MTVEELYNNYEFIVGKRLLKQKFPFIVDVRAKQSDLDNYSIIFLDLYIDLDKFFETFDELSPASWLPSYLTKDKPYDASYLSMLVKERDNDLYDIEAEINNILRKVHKSPAIPNNMKLPHERVMQKGGVFATPEHNQSYINKQKNLSTSYTGGGDKLSTDI